MKKMLKMLGIAAVMAAVLGFVGCKDEDGSEDSPKPVSISISVNGYTEGEFFTGEEASLTAVVKNTTSVPTWTVTDESIVDLSAPKGKTITVTGAAIGTTVIIATVDGVKSNPIEITVGFNHSTVELTELPWTVTMGQAFGSNKVFTKNVDDAGHGTWCTNNSEISYDGIYYFGAANGYQYYAEHPGVWFNWYASENTENGLVAGGRLESYMAIAAKSLPVAEDGNVEIKIKARAVLKAETEGGTVKQPKLAIYDSGMYLISDTALTETDTDYTFVVKGNQKIVIGNNGPTGSYMVITGIEAKQAEAGATVLLQEPSVVSITVTVPEEISNLKASQAQANVVVKFGASKEIEWSSSDSSVATISDTGLIEGQAGKSGKITITAKSKLDNSTTGTAETTIVDGPIKPKEGRTYTYWFGKAKSDNAVDCSTLLKADTVGESPDGFLSWNNGWKKHDYGLQTGNNSELYIQVAGTAVVGWTGYTGSGTIDVTYKDASNEDKPLLTNISAANKPKDSDYTWFIYEGDATTLTLKKNNGTSYFSEITVKPKTTEAKSIKSVAINGAKSVAIDKTITLKSTVEATYFADTSVTWTSSDDTIATIEDVANGVVKGVAEGTVTITATSTFDTSKSATYEIKVTADITPPVYGRPYSWILTDKKDYSNWSDAEGFLSTKITGGQNDHGPITAKDNTFSVFVAGPCTISIGNCNYNNECELSVKSSEDDEFTGTVTLPKGSNGGGIGTCSNYTDFVYEGNATILTFTYANPQTYLREVKVTPTLKNATYTLTDSGDYSDWTSADGLLSTKITGGKNSHGPVTAKDNTFTLAVGGACIISIGNCNFNNACNLAVKSSVDDEYSATVSLPEGTGKNNGGVGTCSNYANALSYTGVPTVLTFTYGDGQTYLREVKVVYSAE